MGRGPRLHAHFFGRLRAAQGNGAVFRMGGYGRHRRQWVKQLINYIEKHNILFQFQFGFRKGHLTVQAVCEIADNLREAIDNNLYTCEVFIDFSKAFDTVNHEIL